MKCPVASLTGRQPLWVILATCIGFLTEPSFDAQEQLAGILKIGYLLLESFLLLPKKVPHPVKKTFLAFHARLGFKVGRLA